MATGILSTVTELIGLKTYAGNLTPTLHSRAYGQLVGNTTAKFRGRGLDFQEVRHYQPGDELRSVDWRVTARTGRAHTKIFHEERERPVLLVVDLRDSMKFGSQCCFKSVQAAEIAALLGWATLANGDRAGGFIFNDTSHTDIRPSSNKRSFLQLLNNIADYSARPISAGSGTNTGTDTGNIDLEDITRELRRVARPGTAIFYISDFYDFDERSNLQLSQLGRHCDITALHIYDPMEASLPNMTTAAFTDGHHRVQIDNLQTISGQLADHYQHTKDALFRQLQRAGIAALSISTTDDAVAVLERNFHRRLSKTARMEIARG